MTVTAKELEPIIAAATMSHRHIHPANHACEGCVAKAAEAVAKYLTRRSDL